jgi:predicted HAD superfamily Cof-like phosphohydrolase
MNELKNTKAWFEQAIPEPTIKTACVQIGCAYEETAELAKTLCDFVRPDLEEVAVEYKSLSDEHQQFLAEMTNDERIQMLDDIVDEIVTRVGIAHMMGFDIEGALAEVNRSNFSKFEDGKPVFDANGKITKGKHYTPPELGDFI